MIVFNKFPTHRVTAALSTFLIFLVPVLSLEAENPQVQTVPSSPKNSLLSTTWEWDDGSNLSEPDCTEWNANNRLECWLWQLQVEIPNESFSADWITVSISGMTCTHFVMQDLKSDYTTLHSLEVSVHTLQATCKGKYHSSGGLSGHVQASVTSKSSLDALQVAFRLLPSTTYTLLRPFTFQTTLCQTHLQATGIHFSGSTSARLIQLFSKTIGHYITQALQDQLCPLLPKQLDPLLTNYLRQFDEWMKPFLPERTTFPNVSRQIQSLQGAQTISNLRRDMDHVTMPFPKGYSPFPHSSVGETLVAHDMANESIYNPIDWSIVRLTLGLFNDQLADHLQQDWFFNSNNTNQYCPQRCQDMFRGLSGWFRSIVGPQMTIPLPALFHNVSCPPLPLHANLTIGFNTVSVQGLDQLDMLQVFRPFPSWEGNVSHNALESHVTATNGIHIEAPIVFNMHMANLNHSLREPFTLKINLTQLHTTLRTSLQVIDWDSMTLLEVVDVIQQYVEDPTPENIRPMLGCLIRTIQQIDNSDWMASIILASISITRREAHLQNQSRSLEEDLDRVVNAVLKLLLREYSELWSTLLQGLVQDKARLSLNHLIEDWMDHHSSSQKCPSVAPRKQQPKWLNFTKFLVLDHFNHFLNEPTTLHATNQYMDCVGKYFEGYVAAWAGGVQADQTSPAPSLLEIVQVQAKHWNAIQRVQLLQPTTDTTLESSIQWGNNVTVPQLQITLQVTSAQLSGTINVTLFSGFQGKMGTTIDYNLNLLENLTVAHMLQRIQCAMVPTAEIRFLPNLTGADLGPQVGLNISAILNNQTIHYSTRNDSKGNYHTKIDSPAPEMAGMAVEWAVEWIRNIVNEALEHWIKRSPTMCPGMVDQARTPDDPDHSGMWYDFPMLWIVGVLVVFAQGGVVRILQGTDDVDDVDEDQVQLTIPLLHSNHDDDDVLGPTPLENDIDDLAGEVKALDRALLHDITHASSNDMNLSQIIHDEDRFLSHDDSESRKPLLSSTALPEIVRFVIPMLIIGTIVLLLSSNLSIGASVDLSIQAGETPIHLPGLFAFSLGNTISELFGAGIYPLLFLVVGFSGIWPYAKLIWMLYIWHASYVDHHRREQRLLTLDALSKFSLVDTYVLVVMLVAFRFHLDISKDLALDVYVTPEFGFYAFLLATCLSLVLGHGMLFFHRRVENSKHPGNVEGDLIDKKSILDHAFDVDETGPRRPLSRIFQVIVVVLCFFAMAFLLLGSVNESFSFEFGGLAGMALGEKNKTTYSLVSLGAAIPKSVEDANSIGVVLLQVAYFFYALVTPLVCLSILLILLLYPMTAATQQYLLVAAEITNAWSAVEVFVLSIVAALFQLSTFASFIIGARCDLINGVTSELIGGNIIPAEDAVCFQVVASVKPNCWYLVVGVLLNSFVVSLVLRLAHAVVHERAGHGTTDSVTRILFGLPLGFCFFGPGVQRGGTTAGNNDEDTDENAPEWRFWF